MNSGSVASSEPGCLIGEQLLSPRGNRAGLSVCLHPTGLFPSWAGYGGKNRESNHCQQCQPPGSGPRALNRLQRPKAGPILCKLDPHPPTHYGGNFIASSFRIKGFVSSMWGLTGKSMAANKTSLEGLTQKHSSG